MYIKNINNGASQMEIFAAGNKYKLAQEKPVWKGSAYHAFARKWIKSKKKYSDNPKIYNIGPEYIVRKRNEENNC